MKTQDKKALLTKTNQELQKLLEDAKQALAALRFEQNQHTLKNTSELTNKRREIAVLQTIMILKKSADAKALADEEGGKKNG